MQAPIQRRNFLKLSTAGAATVFLSSLGCSGGRGSELPPVATSGAGRYLFFASGLVIELRPWQHRILVTDGAGATVVLGGVGTRPGQLNAPAALAVGPDGLLYVADRGNHRVQVFTAGGDLVRSFGSYGSGDGELSYPAGLAFDAQGRLVVSDSRNHRVAVYQPDGSLQGYILDGSGGIRLQAPQAVVAGPGNTVHVADTGNARVQVYDLRGWPLFSYGGYGTEGGGRLISPQSLAIDAQGTAYVGDVTTPSLAVFDRDGVFQGRMAVETAPAHVAFALDGTLHLTGCAPV